MLNNWKQRLLSNWNFMRAIRLVLGIMVLVQAWENKEWLFAILGGVLLYQAVWSVGCCAPIYDIDHSREEDRSLSSSIDKTTFEEIK